MRTKRCSHQLCRGEKTWSEAQHINTITTPGQRKLWRLLLCSYDKLDEYCSTWLVHEHFPTNITEKKIWLDGIDAAELQSIRDSETVGKNLPNFPTVFRYRCVHYPYFSAALADGHTLINNSINRAAMRTKRKEQWLNSRSTALSKTPSAVSSWSTWWLRCHRIWNM